MVSQRQREARKLYKEAHPELFPKPEPTPPKDPNKNKKKKSKFKRTKADSKEPRIPNKPNKSTHRKHPLRVPGMKPGESCYICKAQDHIAKHCPQKFQWEKNKICLLCRQRGHSLKNCFNKNDETMDKKLCYNCGETGHSLAKCPQPIQDGGTKFASCFICNERGHLSKNCPQSTHGIYPKGGCCKICGGVTHLAKDCPNKSYKGSDAAVGAGKGATEYERPRGQVTKFFSGDDLEDDFVTDDTNNGNKDKSSESKGGPASDFKDNNVKPKKKQGPKVVNFVR
uniref:Putative zinc finger CCHC domain-containing protein 9 n=1 Tax=Davidia involucrata TaxID=16924 RepID=A0A5B7AQB5_DAVIN